MENIGNGISVETPLVYSRPLSELASREVYLKLECVQPSGSFKLRGLSASCIKKVNEGCRKFVSSSGGNAGLAVAYSAFKLNIPCQLYVPTYVDARMLGKIRALGAEITIGGENWHEANELALEEANKPGVGYMHPFDDPVLWEEYSKMVTSTKAQLNGKKPSCFVVSVGGGGLLCGVLRGLEISGWMDVPVIAVETDGANCLYESLKAGKIINKPPTSIAKTLGANSPVSILLEWAKKFRLISHVLTDKDAVNGSVRFADDHEILVEYSCGASLATIYSLQLDRIFEDNGYTFNDGPVVVIVCGGSDVTPQMLLDARKTFNL